MSEFRFKADPGLVEQIQADLQTHYPSLHLFIHNDQAQVRGTFPVRSPNGKVLDEYRIEIDLPSHFPRKLPVVREIGGRIPPIGDKYHNPAGVACVILPHARDKDFPIGATFLQYLQRPLHNYFLGQSIVERGGAWPFGEWGHGAVGICEYYAGTDDQNVILAFLKALGVRSFSGNRRCLCGSWKKLKDCCEPNLAKMRNHVRPHLAQLTRSLLLKKMTAK